ncbi:uncharacterized protein BJ171DRAFT_580411 [Polychytrium aggregatum]|uniref:uncharacterized protein n=1 Tax=Polychytrium aggregatum TaxID=110093 RepID=UPI0022FDCD7A|nr:uncharacterized protein BJ171DRAFT_580411 [Polychytrium aggregatum]KAI9205765.1 hypothetical protein BJ171DRAFT_580411 [Polychytrium aggregatum]
MSMDSVQPALRTLLMDLVQDDAGRRGLLESNPDISERDFHAKYFVFQLQHHTSSDSHLLSFYAKHISGYAGRLAQLSVNHFFRLLKCAYTSTQLSSSSDFHRIISMVLRDMSLVRVPPNAGIMEFWIATSDLTSTQMIIGWFSHLEQLFGPGAVSMRDSIRVLMILVSRTLDLDEIAPVFKLITDRYGPLPTKTLANLVIHFTKNDQLNTILALVDLAPLRKDNASSVIVTVAVLKHFMSQRSYGKCLEVARRIHLNGIIPPEVFHQLFIMYDQESHVDGLLYTFEYMKSYYRERERQDLIKVESFNTVIAALWKRGLVDQGFALLEEMGRCGIESDRVTENILLQQHIRSGQIDKALSLFRASYLTKDSAASVARSDTFGTILVGLLKSTRPELAFEIFRDGWNSGLRLREKEWKMFLAQIFTIPLLAHRAFEVVDLYLSQGQRKAITKSTQAVLLSGFSKLGMFKHMDRVLELPVSSSKTMNIQTTNTMMKMALLDHNPQKAISYFDQMIESGMYPTVLSYHILINYFSFNAQIESMEYYFDRMLRQHVRPDGKLYVAMLMGYVHALQASKDDQKANRRLADSFRQLWRAYIFGQVDRALLSHLVKQTRSSLLNEVVARRITPYYFSNLQFAPIRPKPLTLALRDFSRLIHQLCVSGCVEIAEEVWKDSMGLPLAPHIRQNPESLVSATDALRPSPSGRSPGRQHNATAHLGPLEHDRTDAGSLTDTSPSDPTSASLTAPCLREFHRPEGISYRCFVHAYHRLSRADKAQEWAARERSDCHDSDTNRSARE